MNYPKVLNKKLFSLISEMAADKAPFVRRPGRDFTRERKLGFERMIHTSSQWKKAA